METGTVIIGVLFLMLFISPFIFLRDTEKKSREKFLKGALLNLAGINNNSISECKTWNNSIIGIDKVKHVVLFVSNNENVVFEKEIKLNEINKCKVVTKSHTTGFKKENYKVVDSISLAFECKRKTSPDEILDFYNDSFDGLTLSGELQIAGQWAKIVNDEIESIKSLKPGLNISAPLNDFSIFEPSLG